MLLAGTAVDARTVTIQARDRVTGAPVPEFRFIINKDIAHAKPSTTPPRSYSPLVATGDNRSARVDLAPGKYLVTVLGGPFPAVPGGAGRDCSIVDANCGYRLAGKHFTVDSGGPSTVTVELVPNPLPLATMQVRVFHDNLNINGEDDIPVEEGLEGFNVVIHDPTGEVTVDFFGDPLCGGRCVTGPDGIATIRNLPPLKYEVEVIPPDDGWIQTTTIEGTPALDAWLEEGADGLSTEEGFTQAVVWFGFLRECRFGDTSDSCPSNDVAGDNTIIGRVRQIVDVESPGGVDLGAVVPSPYVALTNLSGNDEQVWAGRGNPDGTFTIPDVPPGQYQIVYWDLPQDYIIQFATVRVPEGASGRTINVGDLGMPRWFGEIVGYIYTDLNRNGIRDCTTRDPHDLANCEPGIPGVEVGVRHKDGTVVYSTVTDRTGFYRIPEYFEWEHFLIWEVGYTSGEQIGTCAYRTVEEGLRAGLPVRGYPNNPIHCAGDGEFGPAALLLAQMTPAGGVTWIDSGKLPWGPDQNGGISGIVYYAVTRNEFDPRFAAAEDYEPGIPNVVVNLYEAAINARGNPIRCAAVGPGCPVGRGEVKRVSDTPVASVTTDAWDDNLPTDCRIDREFFHLPPFTDRKCLELPRARTQVKDGVFDGGYAFDGLPAGQYLVEVVPPPGYRHIREADQNTDQGDTFEPAIPPPPCAGPLHLVNDPRNPAHGTRKPLCHVKLVDLKNGFNPGAEFFLMTDNAVPPPGLLRGVLLDDFTVELARSSPVFGEKRGIPNAPIGILDFQGNEITRVYSDKNGYWEVLLPSSYTAHCPTPGGICPGMYQVIGNYAGNPLDPDPRWNPNYGPLRLVFDVWPASWTFADVAIFPITGFIQDPNSGFLTAPVCAIPPGRPDLHEVSTPVGTPGTSFTIRGAGFGSRPGTVTLGGRPIPTSGWSDSSIRARVPADQRAGPQQLLVTTAAGETGTIGITFHVTGPGYDPPIRHVFAGERIQDVLDAARNGDLILVHPGEYFENIIVARNVKLQGFGPGATLIDGRFFNFGGLTPAEFDALVAAIDPVGPETVPGGATITLLARRTTQHKADFATQIDGFAIRGGSRLRGNRQAASQGGGIYAHAFIRHLRISNNLIQSNGGNAGGGIALGQPHVANPDAGNQLNNRNDFPFIHHNRVLNNGGVARAGGIALFNGARGYRVNHNVICGNYSAEYGGGISHYGMSPGGSIRRNEILFNYAFDEGGGIMIAGELPRGGPDKVSAGSGPVVIEGNLIQYNVTNDDGGGIRLLQPVDGPVTIINNMIVNNLATDHGGGISLDDALDVRIVNNTIARNVSTSTAEDAPLGAAPLGTAPQGAGLSTELHSKALRDARGLPAGSFSDPVLFNNIFWENEAFFLDGTGELPSDGFRDLEVLATDTGQLSPFASLLTDFAQPQGAGTDNVIGLDPLFIDPVAIDFEAVAFREDPKFVTVVIRTSPDDPQGDYHVRRRSPAAGAGAAALGAIAAPADDIDGDARPLGRCFDIGADEKPLSGAPARCVVLPGTATAAVTVSRALSTAIVGDPSTATEWTVTGSTRPVVKRRAAR